LGSGRELSGALLPAEPNVLARMRRSVGRVVLGVRPEAIALAHATASDALPAVIDIIEPMGSVNNIVLRLEGSDAATVDGEPFIAVVRSNEDFVQSARTWLTLRPDRLVLFDGETGKALAALSPQREWRSY
jgi:multiple sugar transport system ATP-binding protein